LASTSSNENHRGMSSRADLHVGICSQKTSYYTRRQMFRSCIPAFLHKTPIGVSIYSLDEIFVPRRFVCVIKLIDYFQPETHRTFCFSGFGLKLRQHVDRYFSPFFHRFSSYSCRLARNWVCFEVLIRSRNAPSDTVFSSFNIDFIRQWLSAVNTPNIGVTLQNFFPAFSTMPDYGIIGG
jgi:hypothetical protein